MRSAECNLGVIHPTFTSSSSSPRVARTCVHAVEVAGEDLSEILLAIDDISRQMIQPDPSRIS
jgi:hypothetical protein